MWTLRQFLLHNQHPRALQAGAAALLTAVQQQQQQPAWISLVSSRSLSTNGALQQSWQHAAAATAQCTSATAADVVADAAVSSATAAVNTAGSSSSSILSSLAASSSEGASSSMQQLLLDAGAMSSSSVIAAAQPMEPMWQLLNPIVMGCSAWEAVHSMTGLPWWASIPLTTFAMRTALLPLTLKAKSAGLNFVLAQQATQTATNLIEHWKQQQQPAPSSSTSAGSSSSSSSALGQRVFGLGRGEELKRPSRWRLTRMYYRYYRRQHGTTSLWWWTANVALQLNVFLAMSAALKQMAATQWPGFTTQGLWLVTDLTQAAVVWGKAKWYVGACAPYGVAGYMLPLALVALYLKTVQASPLLQSPHTSLWLKLLIGEAMVLPLFYVSCVSVPQATLLYWISNSAFFYGLQQALQTPRIAHRLNLPHVMLPPPQQGADAKERAELEALRAQQLVCGSEDDGFLRYLAASYLSRGMHEQALQCLTRLTMLAPGDAEAFRALGTTAAELQQWPLSARAFERAAELHAVSVDSSRQEYVECLLLAAKQWLNATAEARAMQRRAATKQEFAAAAAALRKSKQQQQQGVQSQQQSQGAQAGAGEAAGDAAGAAAPGTASSGGSSSKSKSSSSRSSMDDKAAAQVQPELQQEYINSALSLLQQAIHFQEGGTPDAYYLLAMAQAADGKWEPAFEAASTYWARSLALAEDDTTARINAAAKLLPVLNNMCKQRCKQKDFGALLTVAHLAVDVAKCGWDRQTEEQLRDTLGAAAAAAGQQGKQVLSEQIAELQQQLPEGVVRTTYM